MLLVDGRIRMTDKEWLQFKQLNWAPWRPRTPEEFDAMCDLAIARHRADNTDGLGEVYAIATKAMKFGPKGEINFPEDHRRLAFVKVHGYWPNDAQLNEFESGEMQAPHEWRAKLTVVGQETEGDEEAPNFGKPPHA